MQESNSGRPEILITGGTSGLGLQLVRIFLEKGYHVVTTGRREITFPGDPQNVSFYKLDFSDLEMTAGVLRKIADLHEFDIVVNNAGILSPPHMMFTKDGLEYTFQVNFLAHLLVNEIIIRNKLPLKPLIIATVTSPVYKLAKVEYNEKKHYRAYQAYSDSKLYLAIMCTYLLAEFYDRSLSCISFDPGVFGSGIYRMQSRFFGILYRIGAPFMRHPARAAAVLAGIVTGKEIRSGVIYSVNGRTDQIPKGSKNSADNFWKECHEKIRPFLR